MAWDKRKLKKTSHIKPSLKQVWNNNFIDFKVPNQKCDDYILLFINFRISDFYDIYDLFGLKNKGMNKMLNSALMTWRKYFNFNLEVPEG